MSPPLRRPVARLFQVCLKLPVQLANDLAVHPCVDYLVGDLFALRGAHVLALGHLGGCHVPFFGQASVDPIEEIDFPVEECVGGLGVGATVCANEPLFGCFGDVVAVFVFIPVNVRVFV